MKYSLEKLWEQLAECTFKSRCNNCSKFGNAELFKNQLTLTDCYDCHRSWGMEVIRGKI